MVNKLGLLCGPLIQYTVFQYSYCISTWPTFFFITEAFHTHNLLSFFGAREGVYWISSVKCTYCMEQGGLEGSMESILPSTWFV
ncbi:hypothetical protein XELAEV_18035146mg [Xenopus laevis]|uniref:Uncharacterized protein n=1 Tax=Xenopus laevis TaxID=8355 RepID=A0A974CFQ7_XENLA|nr:hypothetical protein XELAEV_18035146mg [Xenopus laevis]